MKSPSYLILFILLVTLILSAFIGSNYVPLHNDKNMKEGIQVNTAIILSNILEGANENNVEKIYNAISKMKFNDPDYDTIMEDPKLTQYQKIVHLKGLLKIMSSSQISGSSLKTTLNNNITLNNALN
jgi:Na+-transporting NADH:ubiquinone oxidoreductase subunit NqrC